MKSGPGGSALEGAGLTLLTGETMSAETPALDRLRLVSRLPYVASPVVALGDLHWKPGLETPSSTATATLDDLVLSFSSPAMNCGMALLKTPLSTGEAESAEFLSRLMTKIRETIPRSRLEPVVTREEALRFAMGGAVAAAERYGLDPLAVAGIEQRGSLFEEGEVDRPALLDALDEEAIEHGMTSFAYIGGGNHFLEIQAVEEILNAPACDAMGVKEGQILIMYHTGSERFGHDLARLYASRLKTSRNRRRKFFFRKIPLHLGRGVRAPGDLLRRWRHHFSRRTYIPIPAESPDGRRVRIALKAGGNYGYANRAAVLDRLIRAVEAATGRRETGFSVIADLSHNIIARERIAGRDLWVHRHNSVRLRPPSDYPAGSISFRFGQPAMLPGTNRTSSYLILSREGAERTLHSADHGGGRTVERFEEAGLLRERPDRTTLKFSYRSPAPETLTHLTDEGIDEVVSLLSRADVASPALRLRPLAVLKG